MLERQRDGVTGISGAITSANSLVGSTAFDQIGNGGVIALTNGNYVVASSSWDNGAIQNVGAATWGNGTSGAVSSANSLVGSTAFDGVGISGVTALTNGNYVVRSSQWNNGAIVDAGAVTFGNGATGTSGAITSGTTGGNSVVGIVAGGFNNFAFDATRNRLIVGQSLSNTVSILFFNTTATGDGAITDAAIFDNGLPDALVNAVIPNGRTVSLNGVSQIGLVSLDCTANLTGASAANYVVGSVRKNFCAAAGASFVYPIGDIDDYSPLTASNVSGTGNLTASVVDDVLPGLPAAVSLSRYWNLEGAGIVTDLTFQYKAADVSGTESTYRAHRRVNSNNVRYPTLVNTANDTATVTGISEFSPWGIGNTPSLFSPTAAGAAISGRVLTDTGRRLINATVSVVESNGAQRTARTTASGYFHFDDLAAGQTVIISVASKRYRYTPQVINLTENLSEVNFTAAPPEAAPLTELQPKR